MSIRNLRKEEKSIAFPARESYNTPNFDWRQNVRRKTADIFSPLFVEAIMKTEEKLNMTMLCDFYELTMGKIGRAHV